MKQVLPMVLLAGVHTLQMHGGGCAALDVTPEQFGAVGDGVHDDTQALRRAFAACSAVPDGPCHVLLARHYSSGPFRFNTSGVTMDVTGVLSMLPRDKYPQTPADQAAYGSFISTQPGIKDLTITGDGLITGLGRQWWPCKYTGCWRPHLIVLSSVTGAKIGPLHMTDGPNHFIEVRTTTIACIHSRRRCVHACIAWPAARQVHLSVLRLSGWVLAGCWSRRTIVPMCGCEG